MTASWACIPGRGAIATTALAAVVSLSVAAVAVGQVPPDYGLNWATVTHPGNAAVTVPVPQPSPFPPFQYRDVGAVDHEYRITTTEVTNAQWFEFVQAYAPFVGPVYAGGTGGSFMGGAGILFNGFNGQGVPTYSLPNAFRNRPVDPGWRFAARYVNWLTNGKHAAGQATAADFENGAYDTSTFVEVPDPLFPGQFTHADQAVHNSGAKFWIPTLDEWVKAAYWDPNKNGPGQPGYWQYPITSDTAPIPGNPALGGQTNAGIFPVGQVRPLDVGSYPTVMSPWGLLDTSGGLSEWTELRDRRGFRYIVGSEIDSGGDPPNAITDRLVQFGAVGIGSRPFGLRIASVVPTPGVFSVFLCVGPVFLTRRRRPCSHHVGAVPFF